LSQEKHIKSRLSHPAWILVLAGVPLLVTLYAGPLFYDDAYITFRYAENIASGAGFVFNEGPVLGTTAPFYCLVLALAGFAGLHIPHAAFGLGVLTGALTPVLVWRLGHAAGREAAGLWGGLLLGFFPRWWLNANTGMETTLAGCFVLAVLIFHFRGKGLYAGLLSGLLVLTRPDTALLPVLVFAHLVAVDRKKSFAFAGGGIAALLPWTIYSFMTFGSPLPHSLAAKGLIHAYPWLLALRHYLDWFLSMSQPMGMAVFSAIWVLGAATVLREFRHAFIVVVWPVVFIAGLAMTEVGPFPWYHIPALPLFMFVVGMGIYAVYEGRGLASRIPLQYRRGACGFIAGAMVFLQLFEVAPVLSNREKLAQLRDKEQKLKKAAEKIESIVDEEGPGSSRVKVLVGEVGVIGYELMDYHVIDSSGINSPEVYEIRKSDWERLKSKHPDYGWQKKWSGSEKWVLELIDRYQPDFITSNVEYLHLRTLLDSPYFRDQYRPVGEWTFIEQGRKKVMVVLQEKRPRGVRDTEDFK